MNAEMINENVFKMIGKDWCLISAADGEHFNMMTASWGGLGVLWNKDVATIYIRPQRYTKQFVDSSEIFTLTFFDDKYRSTLSLLGTKSGRDIDKERESGLHAIVKDGVVDFEEARLTIVCKKIYQDSIKPECFVDEAIDNHYPMKDYHDMYIGEILDVITK